MLTVFYFRSIGGWSKAPAHDQRIAVLWIGFLASLVALAFVLDWFLIEIAGMNRKGVGFYPAIVISAIFWLSPAGVAVVDKLR